MVYARIIPTHVVARHLHATVHHASDELGVWLLILAAELDARPSGVVQEFIVTHPEGSVPGFVVCPTVVGVRLGHGEGCGHVFVSLIQV